MATALFTVKATITLEQEAEFNRWYNRERDSCDAGDERTRAP
jgi:hypothetical protein